MSTEEKQAAIEAALKKAPVVAVLVIDDLKHAVPLARALVAGGLPVLEITLRTQAALDSMRAIMAEVEGAVVGAGTVITKEQLQACDRIGCAFAVSPGSTSMLLDFAGGHGLPLLPGAATASEVMGLLERGYRFQKFFPAEAAGGVAALAALAAPLPQVTFCPTGGITAEKACDYLRLPNVITVGGSWMAPRARLAAGDWKGIEALARQSASLK
jgi:2-dehydro-3-deoxyphosphogluconate aldolase/(4S)-4-hydroxy-2-oxoglutarate aldolase